MNFTQLTYLKTIYESDCNMTAAAKKLYVSQPSVSKSVRELEKELRVELFHRDSRNVSFTEAGREALAHAEEILESRDMLTSEMQRMAAMRRTVRIGIPTLSSSILVPSLIKDFRLAHPDIYVEITAEQSKFLMEGAQDGRYDITFINQSREGSDDRYTHHFSTTGYDTYDILPLHFAFCTGPRNPLAKRESISYGEVGEAPLVLVKYGNHVYRSIENRLRESGAHPNILFYTNQISTIRELVAAGEASTFIFRELLRPNDPIVAIPLSPARESDLKMIVPKKAKLTREQIEFIEYVRSYDMTKFTS